MKDNPLISVVLPVYNCGEFIEEALKSILNQTLDNFEVLIIDDASTDGTLELIKKYKDSRIKIIEKKENSGLIDSLNTGFKISKGEFIARMDGDDISHLRRFEKQYEFLKDHPEVSACGCWIEHIGAVKGVSKYLENHEDIQAHLLVSNPMALCATMLRKTAYSSFSFRSDSKHYEDYDFWVESMWECQVHNLQEILYYYRIHAYQVSTKWKNKQIEGDQQLQLKLFKKLNYNERMFSDSLIRKLIFSNESFRLSEFKKILQWFNVLRKRNLEYRVFEIKAFECVLDKLRRRLVRDTFLTNKRGERNFKKRIGLLLYLSSSEKWFVINRKLREKYKLIFKSR
ncbi:glycosyltransferase family 2 protein [Salegentibacter mishustinae]|uniref:glycosyltransferase family 2 protein n=1 Tax=Salegentibacter mishustinae TaxID=270918 RepID=UPI00248F91FB|nr:glycosyltransferase family 2 protein [Salegentibacter mishustinae]